MQQLPLEIHCRSDATLDNFEPGENALLLQQLKLGLSGKGERFFYLWGGEGVGCSHLLQACCHFMGEEDFPTLYLPLKEFRHLSPEMLEQLDTLDLVCIDDIDSVAGDIAWEEGLFHLYNKMRDQKALLIVSSHFSPQTTRFHLADLKSRLSWGLSFKIQDLSDELKQAVLVKRAKERGLFLSESVAEFLLKRCTRNMGKLMGLLDELDKLSLAEQRRLTIPFVKEILSL